MADQKRDNLAPLKLHVPEPKYRPGDSVDFSDIEVPDVDALPKPDENSHPSTMSDLSYGLVRVLDFDNQAKGSWNPDLDADKLRSMLRNMMLLRAFDDRMFRAQRQGKTSFYMKSTGEEATSVAATMALDREDMCFPSYRQQGILITREYPLTRMMNQIYSNSGDHLKGRQLPVMYSAPDYGFFSVSGNLTTQYPQAVGWAMASASRGDNRISAVWCGEGINRRRRFPQRDHLCRCLQCAGHHAGGEQPMGDQFLFRFCRRRADNLCCARGGLWHCRLAG